MNRRPLTDERDPRHGSENGYTNLGCRCDRCKKAHARKEPRAMPEREPLLYVGGLSHRVYLTHRYKQLPNGIVEVTGRKWDVTSQIGNVLAELDRLGLELTPVPAGGGAPTE